MYGHGRRAASRSVVGSCRTVLADSTATANRWAAARLRSRVPTGIVFVLRSGIPWQMLPQELGCGSGMTCWRRLRDWQQAGVWELIHFALLDWLARDDQIDWSRAVVDSCSIRAVYGGDQTGPNPTDRAKRGSKRHLICEGQGRTARCAPDRREPERLAGSLGVGGCDSAAPGRTRATSAAAGLCARGPRLRCGRHSARSPGSSHRALAGQTSTAHGSGRGRWRWVVERTFAWLSQVRRLRVRYDKRADIHEAFLSLGCALICWQSLRRMWRTA